MGLKVIFTQHISIHAPLTGSDARKIPEIFDTSNFNPRSPHRERHRHRKQRRQKSIFQSTLPSQGATSLFGSYSVISLFQSTLPSQGATTLLSRLTYRVRHFNPRSPHRERLKRLKGAHDGSYYFNPRSPHRERRLKHFPSIFIDKDFNPRSPHRERQRCHKMDKRNRNFNPRSPHRERHFSYRPLEVLLAISIHAPLTGSDLYCF